ENITKLTLYGKPERGSWEKLSELNPKALNPVTTRLKKNKRLRYLKLTYELNNKPYSKAFLWEIKTYDKSGPFGDFPTFHQPQQTLKESFGINGFWGWGSQKHADKIATDKAPFIFTDITKNLRYYHNMDWDVAAPDIKPDYKNMNSGSLNQNWLNWNREYIPLRKNGFDIIASIQFSNVFSDSSWKTPYKSAFQYGQAFAQYFGKFGNNTVKEIEIGNEPWGYSIKIYREILQGMANGIKSSDPSMKIFSCALDVAIDQPELNNNITNRLTQTELNLIDGINTHIYPYAYNKEGERYATFPEHPESGLRRILGIINYRDKYLAGKPIYLTEYGWDCSTKESDCSHNECVSEDAQAVYAVRSLLMLYRLGIEKMYWFFFADEDKSSFQFTRSGLLTSPKHEMKKKRSFFALQQLMQFAGDATLTKIISENDQAWIYLFTDNTGEKFIIAWVPLNHNNFKKETITLDKKYKVKAAYYLNGYRNNKINLPIRLNNNFKISPTPTIFVIN
ncbi:MAG: hypothetical protein U9R32_04305, partial [Bacteroidota bacterium]|nr:hypothetical protein [Bacteroidota bacterium]